MRATLILAIAGSSTLPVFGGMRGLMLCFSSGGHVAIEASCAPPSCAPQCADGAQLQDFAADGATPLHCCTDSAMALSIDLRRRVGRRVPVLRRERAVVRRLVSPVGGRDELAARDRGRRRDRQALVSAASSVERAEPRSNR